MPTARRTTGTALWCCVLSVSWTTPYIRAQNASEPCPGSTVTYSLDSPGAHGGLLEIVAYTGEVLELDVLARIRSTDPDPSAWVQSFTLGVAHDKQAIALLSAALNTDEVPQLFAGPKGTNLVDNSTGAGFVSHYAGLCGGESACWLPAVSDSAVVKARYRVVLPPRGQEPVASSATIETTMEFRDGLRGPGQPVQNVVTVHGGSEFPCLERLDVRILVLESADFVRGDANVDRRIDISDAVTLLRSKFFGDAIVHCDDAGDANDDGVLDISDAIYIFSYLFIGGGSPPAPFPARGTDPTPDDLRCRPPPGNAVAAGGEATN